MMMTESTSGGDMAVATRDGGTDVADMSIPELRAELANALTVTAVGLARAAAIWTELNNRGEDIPLRSGLSIWLPRIAAGALAAEAVVAFAGQRMLLHRMVGMPLDEQRRLAAGGKITVAAANEAGEIVHESRAVASLSSREVTLAIADGTVRPLDAQTRSLAAKRPRRKRASRTSAAIIRADTARGLLQIGRSSVAPDDIVDALARLGWRMERREDS